MLVKPAYGRDYKSVVEVFNDWLAGRDFKMSNGRLINITDAETYEVQSIGVDFDHGQRHVTLNKYVNDWTIGIGL